MQWKSCGLAVLLAGCTHLPVNPAQLSVTVTPDAAKSGHVPGEVALRVTVRNDSRRTLHLAIDEGAAALIYLNWVYYSVYKATPAGWVKDLDHQLFADGNVTTATLHVGAGDSATVMAFFEHADKADCSQMFALELRDTMDRPFRSQPFSSCVKP